MIDKKIVLFFLTTLFCTIDLVVNRRSLFLDSGQFLKNMLDFGDMFVDNRIPRYNDLIFQFIPWMVLKLSPEISIQSLTWVFDLNRYICESLVFLSAYFICRKNGDDRLGVFVLLVYFSYYLVLTTNPGGFVQGTMAFSVLLFVLYQLKYHLRHPITVGLSVLSVGLGYQLFVFFLIFLMLVELNELKQNRNEIGKRCFFILLNAFSVAYLVYYLVHPNTPLQHAYFGLKKTLPLWIYGLFFYVNIALLLIFSKKNKSTGFFITISGLVLSVLYIFDENKDTVNIGQQSRMILGMLFILSSVIYFVLDKLKKDLLLNFSLGFKKLDLIILIFSAVVSVSYLATSNRLWTEGLREVQSYQVAIKGCVDVPVEISSYWEKKYSLNPYSLSIISILLQNSRNPDRVLTSDNYKSNFDYKNKSCSGSYKKGLLDGVIPLKNLKINYKNILTN